jgi:hypothetical protein
MPVDNLEEVKYLTKLYELTEPYEFFQRELYGYLEEYKTFLSSKYKKETVSKHCGIISYGIDYIIGYHSVAGFEEITFGMISSKLYYDFKSSRHENISRKTLLSIMKKFFEFIYETQGIQNKKLMEKLRMTKI